MPIQDLEAQLANDIGKLSRDPYGFVRYAFPWGEGELADCPGPRKWQVEELKRLRDHLANPATRHTPCRIACSSGHGPGKSTFASLVTCWALSTFEDCKVIVTANTKTQLDTKTQPEMAKWFRLAINSSWFVVNATSIKIGDPRRERTWRADFIPWSEANPQAFAGAHNRGKRIVIIFDEASEIADAIWEVAEGALTDADTEIIWLALGNCTRSTGRFHDVCFGSRRHRWNTKVIDSRDVEGTDKKQIAEWAQDYGEDSDWFRVRVRGLPPVAGSAQYIDMETIRQAQQRPALAMPDDPLVCGVDFAWGGADDNVIRFRRGFDARSIKPIRIKGEFTRDPAIMVNRLAQVLCTDYDGHKVAMMFVDSAGIAGPVVARLRELGHKNIQEVNFGGFSPDPHYAYMRDYMWGKMKLALISGLAIDKCPELEADLSGPSLVSDLQQRVKLESKELMKKRGVDSPDDGDSLALTYTHAVAAPVKRKEKQNYGYDRDSQGQGWMG